MSVIKLMQIDKYLLIALMLNIAVYYILCPIQMEMGTYTGEYSLKKSLVAAILERG